MLTGHAYARAVRGHLLVQTVFAHIVLEQANLTDAEKTQVVSFFSNMDELTPQEVESMSSVNVLKFKNELDHIKANGPTAALWVQYFDMITLM